MTAALRRLWLTVLVHFGGFRAAPRAYLVTMWWLIRRKRVRARGQLAPLLARSPLAYTLYSMRTQQLHPMAAPSGAEPPIVALIAAAGEDTAPSHALAETLASMESEGLAAIVVSSDPEQALARLDIDWPSEPWIMMVREGDVLAPGAAQAYRAAMVDDAALIYADDDRLGPRGQRRDPHFKPDWNSELFAHHDYLTAACLVRLAREDLADVTSDERWPAHLVKLAVAKGPVKHVAQVLHHRRARPAPTARPEPLAIAIDLPPVTIIVPTRNRVDLLRTCLDGIAQTDYPRIDVIVVDNDSDDAETLAYLAGLNAETTRVLHHGGAFNYSAINNRAVHEATGQLVCLLNNDIEVIDNQWLKIMATQALRPEVGAVGAQLLYPDGRIQHAGVVIGMGNAAGHAHRFLDPDDEGYFRRHSLPQFASAVTAACLVVARDRFLAVGGLDETNFAVAYNDVDLCLRLNQRGWQSFYEPRARLIHHESVSRGFDRDPVGARRFAGELAALQRIWQTDRVVDPFHHPRLSRASEQFALAL